VGKGLKAWGNAQKATLKRKFAFNIYAESRNRYNNLIFVRLKEKKSNENKEESKVENVICIATYHMPCVFWCGPFMVIHASLAAQRAQFLAGDDPLILAGDWNFTQTSGPYQFITTNKLERNHPDYPPPLHGDSFNLFLRYPMKSSYKEVHGKEPDFTNYARTKEGPLFADSIDFIFISPTCQTLEAQPLSENKETITSRSKGSLPSSTEPSDHLMLSALISYPPRLIKTSSSSSSSSSSTSSTSA